MNNKLPENYIPLFEIGMVNDNPAVKILGEFAVCPTTLAALMTTLFEAVMKSIEESDQVDYEKYFIKSFKVLMKERHNYDVTYRFIEDNNSDDE